MCAARCMETQKDKLKPQLHDLNWKAIHSHKLYKFLISMGATKMFKPHSNFMGGKKFRCLLAACCMDG
jgi:hypothetical protein